MEKDAAIVVVVLVEVLIFLLAAIGVLYWRLRLAGQRAGTDPAAAVRNWLDETLHDNDSHQAAMGGSATAQRRSALEAEREALASNTEDERDAVLRVAYTPTSPDTDEETERLRRLLQREEHRITELLTLRDELGDLRLRYDRVRRLAERLAGDSLPESQRQQVTATYQQLESEWTERLGTIEARFSKATADIESTSAPAPVHQPEHSSTKALLDSQSATLARLRETLGEDAEDAQGDLDDLIRQRQEFETCVQMLESENHRLQQKLAAAGLEMDTTVAGARD